MNDRAVSDIVGYVLIFSLIVATVGVVTTVGFGTLEDRQTAERINNVERAFDVFAANVENVYREGAPSRATEIRLSGGEIRHGDAVTITVEADNGQNVSVSPRPFVYADDDTEIIYVAGAVIRSESDSSVMLREPPFYVSSEVAAFPLVETFRTSGPMKISVGGTVRVTSTARGVDTTVPDTFTDSGTDTSIIVESPRSDAWARYFESQDGMTNVAHDEAAGRVEADIEIDRVTAPRFGVRLKFSA